MTTTTSAATATAPTGAGPGRAAAAPDPADPAEFLRQEVRVALTDPDASSAWRALAEQPGWNGENDPRPLYRVLGRRGLLAPNWPAAFGGRGLPAWSAAIVVEELIAAGVPEVLHTLSVQICGNFLLTAGSPEQRAATLAALAAGTAYCTVLYTEPAAGSDLASLATVAEPDGSGGDGTGGWLITGRKVYSVRTGLADFGLVAARIGEGSPAGSDPYKGITLFLLPLSAPGITVDVLPSLADEAFADVRLDHVPVTADRVIGPVGGGWPLITAALALERTGVDYVAKAEAWLRAAETLTGPDPAVQSELGRLWTRTRAARALSARCVAELDTGQVDPVRAAVAKLWTSENAVEVAHWATRKAHDAGLAADSRIEAAYREAPGLVISAGTSQMMCELIAAAGLPTGPDADPLDLGELPGADGMITDLRRAIRWAMPTTREQPGASGPGQDWPLLAELGVFGLHVPEAAGGYGLGLPATIALSAELGAAACDGGLLDTLAAADVLAASPKTQQHLEPILAGRRAAVLVCPDRPRRPLADPGNDGLMIIVRPDACDLLGPDQAAVQPIKLAGEDRAYVTAAVEQAKTTPACDGQAARDALATDLLRRAAWLLGAGWAALTATAIRASSRQQFGRPLIGNQSVSFRLASLTAHGRALGALLSDLATAPDGTAPPQDQAAGILAEAGRFASEAVRDGVQLHGAFGMVRDSPVEPLYRRVRLMIAQCPTPWTLDQLALPATTGRQTPAAAEPSAGSRPGRPPRPSPPRPSAPR